MQSIRVLPCWVTCLILCSASHLCHAQWQQCSGPSGGAVVCQCSHGHHVYTGFYGGGVFMSSDDGLHWQHCAITSSCDTVYALVANQHRVVAGSNHGVFISSDEGQTWQGPGLATWNIRSLCLRDSLLFAATTGGGVYRSTDLGQSWMNVRTAPNDYYNGAAMCWNDSTLWLDVLYAGLYSSSDMGNTWVFNTNGVPSTFINTLICNNGVLFAGAPEGLFYSTDNGETWKQYAIAKDSAARGVFVSAIGDSVLAAQTGSGRFLSTNNGVTWDTLQGHGVDIRSSCRVDSVWIIGSWHNGVYRSTDRGMHWDITTEGLSSASVSVLISRGDRLLATSEYGGIYSTMDGGEHWTISNSGLVNLHVGSGGANDGTVFLGTDYGMYTSTDDGRQWQPTTFYSATLGLSVRNQRLIAANSGKLFLSTDNGVTWNRATAAPLTIYYSAFDDDSVLYAGQFGGAEVSYDGGQNWYDMLLPNNHTLAWHRNGPSLFAAVSAWGVYRSDDGGYYWDKVNNNSGSHYPNSFLQVDSTLLMGSMDNGVEFTTDNGESWQTWNEGLPTLKLLSLCIHHDTIYAGTVSRGVVKRSINQLPHNAAAVADLTKVEAVAVSPNPCSEWVSVHIAVRSTSFTHVQVVSMFGEVIQDFSMDSASQGAELFRVDCRSLSPGAYVIRVLDRQLPVQSKPFVVVR